MEELRAAVGHRPLILAGASILPLDAQGRVLLHRRTDDGCWDVIGGILEPGETFEAAARREMQEETGLTLGALDAFEVYSGSEFFHEYPNGDQVYFVGVAFTTMEVHGEPRLDPAEVQEIAHFALDALPDPLLAAARCQLDRLRLARSAP